MVCGCIASRGEGDLAFIDITMDAQQYFEDKFKKKRRIINKDLNFI